MKYLFLGLLLMVIPARADFMSKAKFTQVLNSTVLLDSGEWSGSGWVTKKNNTLYIITAGHVCSKNFTLTVTRRGIKIENRKEVIIKISPKVDLCALSESENSSFLNISTSVQRNECYIPILHTGYPNGNNLSVTSGLHCGEVQFAPVIPGESGGPVVDEKGDVIGVVIERLEIDGHSYTNFVDVDYLREFVGGLP